MPLSIYFCLIHYLRIWFIDKLTKDVLGLRYIPFGLNINTCSDKPDKMKSKYIAKISCLTFNILTSDLKKQDVERICDDMTMMI